MREFDKNQKVAIVTLGCVAIFVFFGAFWQFKTRLTKPFDYGTVEKNKKISFGCQTGKCDNDLSNLMTEPPASASGTPIADSQLEIPANLKGLAVTNASSSINLSNLDQEQEAGLQSILSGQSDAASLRALMISGGADQEMLKNISDEDLLKIYKESLDANTNSQDTSSEVPADNATTSPKK